MKRRIQSISPHQSAMTMAVLYALIGTLMLPLLLFASPADGEEPLPKVILLAFPLLFAGFSYASVVVSAVLYNLVARWVGGIEVTFDEQRPGVPVRRVRRAPAPPEESE